MVAKLIRSIKTVTQKRTVYTKSLHWSIKTVIKLGNSVLSQIQE